MKYRKFNYIKDFDWFYIIPSLVITKDEAQYISKNFSIQIHWLGFHIMWFWMRGEE